MSTAGTDTVPPARRQQGGEQLALQVVHQVVLDLELARQVDVAFTQHDPGLIGQMDADPAHPLDDRADVGGDHVRRMAPSGGLGDMDRQGPHPLHVGHDPDRGNHCPQVGGDRRLQGEQLERDVLGVRAHLVEPDVGRDDLLGQAEIGIEQGLGGVTEGVAGDLAHQRTVFAQVGEPDLVGLSHDSTIEPTTGQNRPSE